MGEDSASRSSSRPGVWIPTIVRGGARPPFVCPHLGFSCRLTYFKVPQTWTGDVQHAQETCSLLGWQPETRRASQMILSTSRVWSWTWVFFGASDKLWLQPPALAARQQPLFVHVMGQRGKARMGGEKRSLWLLSAESPCWKESPGESLPPLLLCKYRNYKRNRRAEPWGSQLMHFFLLPAMLMADRHSAVT